MNYGKEGYKGVTETWNIVQHEVCNERSTHMSGTGSRVVMLNLVHGLYRIKI